MFFIVPENNEDLRAALVLLSNYHVATAIYCDDDGSNLYLAVIHDHWEPKDDNDIRLAEMAFQMNWQQGTCPECKGGICGHLSFTRPIPY
jgi:hypothetical protein